MPEEIQAMARRIGMPDYAAWERKIRATGGCSHPIRVAGSRTIADAQTGELLDSYTTDDDPLGYVMIPCGNRRASRCPACSQVHRSDTLQLVRAGLLGGKGVPESVAGHPVIFATLTAPSFGPVHASHRQLGRDGRPMPCRPRRDADICPHRTVRACGRRHEKDDPLVGQSMCLDCYDYAGAVLFNAMAGELWRRLTIYLRRDLASAIGESRAGFDRQTKLAFMKVAEYQARGVIHYHAVIRLDGPEGPGAAPPDWASVDLLDSCLRRAMHAVHVEVPDPDRAKADTRSIRFGRQIDVQAVNEAPGASETAVTSRHVALYLSKYVTKGAEACGTVDHRIKPGDLDLLHLPPHAERMIRTCFELADTGVYNDLLLRKWAHMLGYRGHVATKSRAYSTTYGRLRGERKAHQESERRQQAGLPPLDDRPIIVDAEWRFIRAGLSYGEKWLVDAIRNSQQRGVRVDQAGQS
jgi:hypothetical protein